MRQRASRSTRRSPTSIVDTDGRKRRLGGRARSLRRLDDGPERADAAPDDRPRRAQLPDPHRARACSTSADLLRPHIAGSRDVLVVTNETVGAAVPRRGC
ncbi:MAG: hypothetical protein MZV65_54100 [Chromatiales bacterium]|nr:hypothetical protein [Chromatiales bacterium]